MNKLNEFKKIYWDIKLSDSEVKNSWLQFEKRLTHARPGLLWLKYGSAFLTLVVLFLIGIVGIAQAADPGTPLYPVKILSDKITGKVFNKPEIPVEKRADEVIKASEPKKIDEASKQYDKALDDAEKDVKKDEDKKENLQKTLDRQEEEFKQAIKNNPKSEDKLEKVIEKTQDVKEKLKENKGNKNRNKKN